MSKCKVSCTLIPLLILSSTFWTCVRCQGGGKQGNGDEMLPMVKDLVYKRLMNFSELFEKGDIGKELKFCVKNL